MLRGRGIPSNLPVHPQKRCTTSDHDRGASRFAEGTSDRSPEGDGLVPSASPDGARLVRCQMVTTRLRMGCSSAFLTNPCRVPGFFHAFILGEGHRTPGVVFLADTGR